MCNLSSYRFFEEGKDVHVDREVQGDLGLVDHALQIGLGVLETQTQGPQLDEQQLEFLTFLVVREEMLL
jgi:hypothetical protein